MTTEGNSNSAIPQITRDDEEAGSGDLARENVERLKALFPQIVADGNIDFDVLRQLLGDEVEEGEERYGLNWKGKRRTRAFAMTPSLGTLRPTPADSVDWANTQNIMIEGDNLEVLKLLRRSYAGKVKLIYIDPPYNTGKDFVYPDDYTEPMAAYMRETGQVGLSGEARTSNKESSGRFHSDWLSMIYPRLLLAKEMLTNDGFIAISVDDMELSRLLEIASDVFGEESHTATLVWEKMYTTKNDASGFSNSHEYIVIFGRAASQVGLLPRTAEMDARYTNPDNDIRGPWKAIPLAAKGERSRGRFPVIAPTGKEHFPPTDSHWLYSEIDVNQMIAENRISFGKDGGGLPNVKRFLTEVQQGTKARSLWGHKDAGTNDSAKREMRNLFPDSKDKIPFDFPKPSSLIKRLITLLSDKNSIVMDFFAGSGTTAHAVLSKNIEDGGSRRYLLIQLPEPLSEHDKDQKTAAAFCDGIGKPRNIAELTKERLRRSGAKCQDEESRAHTDTGFRVYKLATSNLKPWQPDSENLEVSILDAVDNVLPDRSEDDLLVELLLKTGIDLTMPDEKRDIAGQTVHALGGGALMVCLGTIADDQAEELGQGMANWVDELDPAQTTVYFKDSGIGSDGNRAATKGNLAAILRQRLGDRIAKIASI